MPKFNLGEKLGSPVAEKSSKDKMFFPSIHVSKPMPKGFEVGQKISGIITGSIVSVREDKQS